jgi:hypothetical protein
MKGMTWCHDADELMTVFPMMEEGSVFTCPAFKVQEIDFYGYQILRV